MYGLPWNMDIQQQVWQSRFFGDPTGRGPILQKQLCYF
jgi:hypothetical protein